MNSFILHFVTDVTLRSPLEAKYIKEIAGGGAVVLFVVILFGIILTIIVVRQRCVKPSQQFDNGEDILKTSSSSEDSSVPSTRSTTPMSPLSPLPSPVFQFVYPEEAAAMSFREEPLTSFKPPTTFEPIYHREPPLSSNVKLVLVVESLRMSDEDTLQNYLHLGTDLNEFSDIHVLHYNRYSREIPSGWLMRNMTRADAVLCVCTKEFYEEWTSTGRHSEGSLVHSLHDYVIGCQNQGLPLSHKYITIIYDEQHAKYIPMVFNSVKHCLLDETEKIYGLITQTPGIIVS